MPAVPQRIPAGAPQRTESFIDDSIEAKGGGNQRTCGSSTQDRAAWPGMHLLRHWKTEVGYRHRPQWREEFSAKSTLDDFALTSEIRARPSRPMSARMPAFRRVSRWRHVWCVLGERFTVAHRRSVVRWHRPR